MKKITLIVILFFILLALHSQTTEETLLNNSWFNPTRVGGLSFKIENENNNVEILSYLSSWHTDSEDLRKAIVNERSITLQAKDWAKDRPYEIRYLLTENPINNQVIIDGMIKSKYVLFNDYDSVGFKYQNNIIVYYSRQENQNLENFVYDNIKFKVLPKTIDSMCTDRVYIRSGPGKIYPYYIFSLWNTTSPFQIDFSYKTSSNSTYNDIKIELLARTENTFIIDGIEDYWYYVKVYNFGSEGMEINSSDKSISTRYFSVGAFIYGKYISNTNSILF